MKYFGGVILIIIIILGIGNRLKALHYIPDPNFKFSITNFRIKKDGNEFEKIFLATMQLGKDKKDVQFRNTINFDASAGGFYATLKGNVLELEKSAIYYERHPYIKSESAFADKADRFFINLGNLISDCVQGCQDAVQEHRYSRNLNRLKVSPDCSTCSTEESHETEKCLNILSETFGENFVIDSDTIDKY